MDLVALEIFHTVAAEGSVTRAAERLGRAQSNVTTRVQQLEEQLGVPLFLREGKRMQPTPAGEILRGYADRLLALAEEARQAVRPGQPTGLLRLGAMESTAAARLPGPLARLHAQWPQLVLELRTAPSRQLVEQVLAHQLDCALVAWPPPGLEPDAPVERTPVFTESLLLALPASHPPVARPADLRQDWTRQAGGAPPRVLELASYPAILACVAAGRCAGVVPQSVLELLRTPPALHWVPLGTCDTVLVHRAGYATPAFAALQDTLLSNGDDTP
jgi:DNA-binding transcriptional LysR family regulator